MHTISIHESEDSGEAAEIVRSLVAFNTAAYGPSGYKVFAISAKDENEKLAGGVKGHTHWGWLFVGQLWVREDRRRHGLGSRLMEEAEALGKSRGCQSAWLDTFSFQALPFYRKLGYEEFGRLAEYPPGSSRHFLRKRL